jgi:hypothetical protein
LSIAFDGTGIWVGTMTNTLVKLRASDGVTVATANVGDAVMGIAFDGANVWASAFGRNVVTKR